MKIGDIINRLKNDYLFRRFIWSSLTFITTTVFFAYNAVAGLVYRSIWHFSISWYYLILIILRVVILARESKWHKNDEQMLRTKRVLLFRWVCASLLLLNLLLIVPIVLMINGRRPINISMIAAIAVAAYTTYKITASVIEYKRIKRYPQHLSLYALIIINLMDAIVSVLTLQNTLIEVFGDIEDMRTLLIYTSVGMLILMVWIVCLAIKRSCKRGD